jgi:hypothetical protein
LVSSNSRAGRARGGISAGIFASFPLTVESDPRVVSYRLQEIDGFFARNNEEYLALIFEKEGSYLGREVSCLGFPKIPGWPLGESSMQEQGFSCQC